MAAPEMLVPLVDAKTYYGNAGSVPTTEHTGVSDVNLRQSIGMAKRRTRAHRFELHKPTIFVVGLEFKMPWDESDGGFSALWTAFSTAAQIAVKCLPKASGKGVTGDWYVEKFDRSEPSGDEEITADVTLVPAADATNIVAFV